MSVIKTIDLVGVSTESWRDAAAQALEEAARSLRGMNKRAKNSLLREWHGPLTEDLVLRPSEFGLGHVPSRLKPDRTTTIVCGFCSTGCGLNIHLKNGEAVNLSPDTH